MALADHAEERRPPADAGVGALRGQRPPPPAPSRTVIDGATALGLAVAFGVILIATALGGSPRSFVDVPALLVVLGGTFAVTVVSHSWSDIFVTHRIALGTLVRSEHDPREVAEQMVEVATYVRRNGLLALDNMLGQFRAQPFLRQGLQLIIDGVPTDEAERMLRQQMETTAERRERAAQVLRRAAEIAPAMGLIGTLMGLVQMLGNLSDPSGIGRDMALALLTTFYGAILATMVFAPLANKLERTTSDQELVLEIYVLAIGSIGRQENPHRLTLILDTLLPPDRRVRN